MSLLSALLLACGDEAASTPTNPTNTTSAATTVSTTASATTVPPSDTPVPPTTTIPPLPTVTPLPQTPAPATTVALNTTVAVTGGATSPSTVLATTVNIPTTLAAPGLPGRLVYSNQNGQVILMNPDGSGRTVLGKGSSPIFSPDGKRVAFVAPQGKGLGEPDGEVKPVITSVDLNGGDRQDLCTLQPHFLLRLLRWSPRNRFVAFTQTATNSDGGAVVNLCNISNGTISKPLGETGPNLANLYDWTPDGDNSIWQATVGTNGGKYRLLYGDPDKGGQVTQGLTNGQFLPEDSGTGLGDFSYRAARFSPDGKTIAVMGTKLFFISAPGQQSPLNGKTLDLNGSYGFVNLAFSPDGQALVYTETVGNASVGTLKKISLSGGQIGLPINLVTDVGTNFDGGVDWTRQ